MNKLLSIIVLTAAGLQMQAEETEKKFQVDVHGFVGVNAFFDSRQNATARNGNIYLYPLAPQFDSEGNDLNNQSSFDIDAAFSRFNLGISGPDMLGAKTFGFVEGDFLGDKAQGHDLYFRLRHAFVRFNWEKTSLLVGQTWHPLFLTENFPATVTLSSGTPYHPLNRQPMIRFGYQINEKTEFIAFLMSQNDFLDKGMQNGVENSKRPEICLQLKYKKNGLFAAITSGYKSLKPHLADPGNALQTNELAQSAFVAGSISQAFKPVTIKAEAIYGGGMSNLVLLGGFAKKNSGDPQTQYTPLRTLSLWNDIHTNHKVVQPGLFIGYTENLGANERAISSPELAIGHNIRNMLTLAPRLMYFATSKILLGLEWMYTEAAYGSNHDENAKPIRLENVSNHRITTCLRYTF